jgi:hypothetical protein
MDHGRRWICSARSDAGTGSIGADGGVSANSHRRRDIAATGEETLQPPAKRHCELGLQLASILPIDPRFEDGAP